jgi:hypothetical protein
MVLPGWIVDLEIQGDASEKRLLIVGADVE